MRYVIALVLLAAVGCDRQQQLEVTVPRQDTSDPMVHMSVVGASPEPRRIDDSTGDIEWSFRNQEDERITILAIGEDPEGVKRITLWRDVIGYNCISEEGRGDIGQTTSHPPPTPPEAISFSEDPGVGPGGQSVNRRVTGTVLNFEVPVPCSAGFAPSSLSMVYYAEVENFHGGTARTPNLTVHLSRYTR